MHPPSRKTRELCDRPAAGDPRKTVVPALRAMQKDEYCNLKPRFTQCDAIFLRPPTPDLPALRLPFRQPQVVFDHHPRQLVELHPRLPAELARVMVDRKSTRLTS